MPSDVNFDCFVDITDLALLARQWLSADAAYSPEDVNGDGSAGLEDYAQMARAWLRCTDPATPGHCQPYQRDYLPGEFFKGDKYTLLHWEFNDGTARDLSGHGRSATSLGPAVSFAASSYGIPGRKLLINTTTAAADAAVRFAPALPVSGAPALTFEFILQNPEPNSFLYPACSRRGLTRQARY